MDSRFSMRRSTGVTSARLTSDGDVFAFVALDQALPEMHELTSAESDVVRLLVLDWDYRTIAERRGVSVNTVGNQVASIFGKLGVASRFELVARIEEASVSLRRSA